MDKREKAKEFYVDESAAKGYVNAANRLAALFPQLPNDFTVCSLMKSADVVRQEEAQGADDALLNALSSALGTALDNLNAMRLKEGKKLADGLSGRCEQGGEAEVEAQQAATRECILGGTAAETYFQSCL